jgi:DNA-binding YbaB/EbfC family protein
MSDFSNIQNLFETAQRIQTEVTRVRAELATKTVAAETGGGLVKCTANGKGDLLSLDVDPSILGPDNRTMLQDLVVGAVNVALDRARQLAQDEIVRVTGGLPLPPGVFGG